MTASGTPDGGGGERYRPEEISLAIETLTDADIARVKKMARHFAPRSGMSPEDLEQETYVRALSSRTCRVGVGIVAFLGGTMKSIASESPRARKRAREQDGGGLELVYIGEFGTQGVAEPEADHQSPEGEALSRIYHQRALDDAMATIADDEELQLLVEGLFEGMQGRELEELLDTDAKGLAAAKKRLARRVAGKVQEGVI